MVNPNNFIRFLIWTDGRIGAETAKKPIKDVETFEFTFSNGVEEWYAYDMEGWRRALMTAKACNLTISAKRNNGDTGSDYLAGLFMANGEDANTGIDVIFPDGSIFEIPVVANVTNIGGGASTDVAGLEAELVSDGKPTYTPGEG